MSDYRQKYFDLRILIKQLRMHEKCGIGDEDYPFRKYVAKRAYYQKLVDDFIKEEK